MGRIDGLRMVGDIQDDADVTQSSKGGFPELGIRPVPGQQEL